MAESKIPAPAKAKVIKPVVQSNGDSKSTVVTNATTVAAATPINNVKDLFPVQSASKITKILGRANTALKKDSVRLGFALLPAIANPKATVARLKEFNKQGIKNVTTYFDKMGGKIASNAFENLGFPPGKQTDAMLDGILGAKRDKPLSQLFKEQKDTVEITINGAKQTVRDIKNWDPKSVSGLVAMINDIAGDEQLAIALDLKGEFAMLKTLNDTALQMGIYGVIDVILKDRHDVKLRRAILLDGLPTAVTNGDINYVHTTLKDVSLGAVFARCPNIIGDLFGHFRLPDDKFYPDHGDYDNFTGLMDKLSTTWRFATYVSADTYNLELFGLANEATRMTLSLDNDLNGPINIAPNYKVQDCRVAFKECYPFY